MPASCCGWGRSRPSFPCFATDCCIVVRAGAWRLPALLLPLCLSQLALPSYRPGLPAVIVEAAVVAEAASWPPTSVPRAPARPIHTFQPHLHLSPPPPCAGPCHRLEPQRVRVGGRRRRRGERLPAAREARRGRAVHGVHARQRKGGGHRWGGWVWLGGAGRGVRVLVFFE